MHQIIVLLLLVACTCHAFVVPSSNGLKPTFRPATGMFDEALDETVLADGSLERERYIACNRFKCRKNAMAKFEKRWVDRTSRLAELDGFRWFSLLKRVEYGNSDYSAEGDFGNYMSLTVWDQKENFDEWRTGEAFKEAHGGGGIGDFMKLLGTALFILDGAPKPAFYDGLLPVRAENLVPPGEQAGGWRSDLVADGQSEVPADVFIAMNRFTIPDEARVAFEQRWASRESKLQELPGFLFFNMLRRDASKADDGYNYVSMTAWQDRAAFENWRTSQQFGAAHGGEKKPEGTAAAKPAGGPPPMFQTPPKVAFYEGKIVLQSAMGP
ncbi:unnamed protein product [Heterosigma akashiwo]|uniref:ABM domain-containing protein n=1 Tax=Heterosigma akashiwo TaxID=2829 RepID=A0A6V1P4V6_HETAK|eukprot:CAMPEP_0194558768 /NCGR_PEP_ID=MMETSP0292-20121207/562_1 /TAXON_ID=39354 /ORGANISM="Heterosigma akashiwo, Strain CCMP2393" /LENGTH=325 /DNA_ID=CAMNT_0039406505 /DNA_START=45 /DNA_END=1022 /DNA_ORIENTATION=+